MAQSVPFTNGSDADIARALAEVSQDGWPADEEDLIRLFGRMLRALGAVAPSESALAPPSHTLLLLKQ